MAQKLDTNSITKNSKEGSQSQLKVYENDEAYLFSNVSDNFSNDDLKQSQININSNININNNEITIQNLNLLEDQPSQKGNQSPIDFTLGPQNMQKNSFENNNNKKYIIDEIDTDLENNKQKFLSKQKIENNLNEKQNEELDDSNESSVPLVTLNFLSICQCCKNQFNSNENIPYLFKCGHFFCKKCIIDNFTDEEGIKCPSDGLVCKSITDLKILNNFITDKTVTQRTSSVIKSNMCKIHKDQKLTHFIENTNQLICVYCAFEKFKQNPKSCITEISDKLKKMEKSLKNLISQAEKNVNMIQNLCAEIKKNKNWEEKRVIEIFDNFFSKLYAKKEEILNNINNIFSENAQKLSQKLEIFSLNLKKCEDVRQKINNYNTNEIKGLQDPSEIFNIINMYNNLNNSININENTSKKILLKKYIYTFEDEDLISKLIDKFGIIKITPNNSNFISNKDTSPPKNKIAKIKLSNNNSINNTNNNIPLHTYSNSGMNINVVTNINQEKYLSSLNNCISHYSSSYSHLTKKKNNKSCANIRIKKMIQTNPHYIKKNNNTNSGVKTLSKISNSEFNYLNYVNNIKKLNNYNYNYSNKNKNSEIYGLGNNNSQKKNDIRLKINKINFNDHSNLLINKYNYSYTNETEHNYTYGPELNSKYNNSHKRINHSNKHKNIKKKNK